MNLMIWPYQPRPFQIIHSNTASTEKNTTTTYTSYDEQAINEDSMPQQSQSSSLNHDTGVLEKQRVSEDMKQTKDQEESRKISALAEHKKQRRRRTAFTHAQVSCSKILSKLTSKPHPIDIMWFDTMSI